MRAFNQLITAERGRQIVDQLTRSSTMFTISGTARNSRFENNVIFVNELDQNFINTPLAAVLAHEMGHALGYHDRNDGNLTRAEIVIGGRKIYVDQKGGISDGQIEYRVEPKKLQKALERLLCPSTVYKIKASDVRPVPPLPPKH